MEDLVKKYDAVIIGAGPGGLSAGLSLASGGWKVLIAEKNAAPGGNCTAKTVGGYTFDLAVHQLSGIGGGGICARIMKEYGIAGKLDFRQVDPFLVLDMPDRSYVLPGNREGLREELLKDFPGDKKDIDRMLAGLDTLKKDALISQRLLYGKNAAVQDMLSGTVGPLKIATFPFTFFRGMILKMRLDADSMLSRWVGNKKLRAIIHSSWIYLGLPPRRLSGVMMNVFVAMQHMEHSYYPAGSSRKLAETMAEAFREHGGELRLSSPVKKILTEGGRASGVELEDGSTALAGTVISNADALHTYKKLLGRDRAPAGLVEKLEKLKLSVGPFRVCLGLDYDAAAHGLEQHEYILLPGYDHEETYAAQERGELAVLSVYSPSRICPELAPPGHSTLILTTTIPWSAAGAWTSRKEEMAARMIEMVEKKRLPGLSKHIVLKEILTPGDLQRLTNSSEGAMYGWANTPGQVLTFRFSMKSPLRGLYHAGHWTRPGTGVTTAILSGWLLGNRLKSWVGKYLDRLI